MLTQLRLLLPHVALLACHCSQKTSHALHQRQAMLQSARGACLPRTARSPSTHVRAELQRRYARAQVNSEIVAIQRVRTAAGEQQLRKLVQDHVDLTGSARGAALLADWGASLPRFWQLVPPSESFTPEVSEEALGKVESAQVAPAAA